MQCGKNESSDADETEKKLTFDDGQGAPLSLLPSRRNEPLPHFADEVREVLRIRLHDLIELGELAGPEEDLRHAELEVVLVQAQRLEQRLRKWTKMKVVSSGI